MKKIIMVAGASLLSTVAMAKIDKNGFSVGLQGGYISHSASMNSKDNIGIARSDSVDTKGDSGSIGLLAGYTMNLNSKFFAGLEIYGHYQDAKSLQRNTTTANAQLKVEATMRESYGTNILLGMRHDRISPFVKLGYVNSKFELKRSYDNLVKTNNKRLDGFLLGLGADYKFHKNWSVGADYSYTWYKEIKVGSSTLMHAYKPQVNNVNVRLKYNF